MDALTSIEGLWVQGNEQLLTLHGLPSLVDAGSAFYIDGNPRLPQCEVDAIVERAGAFCYPCANDTTATECDTAPQ